MQADGVARVYPVAQLGVHPILRNLNISREELQQWKQAFFAADDLWGEALSLIVGLFGKIESGNEELTRAATERLCMRLTEFKEVLSANPLQLKTLADAVERSAEIGALQERSTFADQVLERLLKLEERSAPTVVTQEVSPSPHQYPFDFSKCTVLYRDMVSWIVSESEDQTELELLIEEIEEMVPGTEESEKGLRVLPELQSRLKKKVSEIERVKRLAGELKKYLDALKMLETPIRAEVLEWKIPEDSPPVSEEVAAPTLEQEQVAPQKGITEDASEEVVALQVSTDQEKLFDLLEQDYGLLRGDVAIISLYEIVGRSKQRSLTTLTMFALQAGILKKFGWENMRDMLGEFSKSKEEDGGARRRYLSFRGRAGRAMMFIRTSEPIPWSLHEIFSDAEIMIYKEEISKPR